VVETHADAGVTERFGRRVDSPFRLLGQVADDEVGLCFTLFRCFDPELGRWISADPLGMAGGANLFGLHGRPVVVVDTLGLSVSGGQHANAAESAEHAQNFDRARQKGFEKAGMTRPEDVVFSKEDPKTGTIVEFKGPAGAKVAYDSPHESPGP